MTLGRAPLAVSGSVSKLSVGRADALLCERTQRLSALNATASCKPIESLCVLIDSSFTSRGRLDSAALAAFAASISGAACYRFTYMDLDSAASAVKALAGA